MNQLPALVSYSPRQVPLQMSVSLLKQSFRGSEVMAASDFNIQRLHGFYCSAFKDFTATASRVVNITGGKALLNLEPSSREMECFVSGMILQRKYAFNSDSVESVSQCTKNLAEGTAVLQLNSGISCSVAWTEILHVGTVLC